ncbi:putative PCI domain containing protein [Monocercomonoides exilis]|uniref:putative PCI domain containing protein n=1 Tax=Monocercomonoides exilis TaxID=2049356 RepID=UPI00355A0DEB|nr:putative PCI domain containing protein [Monocercomonoides exilis]|eukprot:MONOS_3580.1-p1 / transcript=MONOS_3580.1 / gene=MONOS_3580 / organism=Monocercomonoides_exilis_PA203 / gene_product=PCI domain containing protein / transcript_product=PCI domain containing protein / location=Mono_scaffold00085:78537-80482(-) / protein_length=485 / sequence_SO=supercontig / SO=protein_coding / is_pseudo=false
MSSSRQSASSSVSELLGMSVSDYLAQYKGHMQTERIELISSNLKGIPDTFLKNAYNELKDGYNPDKFENFCKKARMLGCSLAVNNTMTDGMKEKAKAELDRLTEDLSTYKGKLEREGTYLTHVKLGEHALSMGDWKAAQANFAASSNYTSGLKEQLEVCVNLIRSGVYGHNPSLIYNAVSKIGSAPLDMSEQDHRVISSIAQCGAGIVYLWNEDYFQAARCLLECTIDIEGHFNEFLTCTDIAIIAALCTLASFSRQHMKNNVIHNTTFHKMTENVPEMKEAIDAYYQRDFKRCLSNVSEFKQTIRVIPLLEPFAAKLLSRIFVSCAKCYIQPFKVVDLKQMADEFNTTLEDIEKKVTQLVMNGEVQAMVDTHNHRLISRTSNFRSETLSSSAESIKELVSQMEMELLYMNVRLKRGEAEFKLFQEHGAFGRRGGRRDDRGFGRMGGGRMGGFGRFGFGGMGSMRGMGSMGGMGGLMGMMFGGGF